MSGNLNSTEEHIHNGNLGLRRVGGQAQRQGIISKWESLQVLEQESDKLGPHELTLRLSIEDDWI